jgi:hypothetical protein
MGERIYKLDDVHLRGYIAPEKFVQCWIEKVISERIQEHGHQKDETLTWQAIIFVSARRMLDYRDNNHVELMPNKVENETQSFVDVFRIFSLKKANKIYYGQQHTSKRNLC